MTRSEIQNILRELGCKAMCDDGKTLCAYNQIQGFLSANRTPMKAITKIYWLEDKYGNKDLHIVLYDNDMNDLESGWTYEEEEFHASFND